MFQILKEYWVTLVIIIAESLYELIPDFFYTRSKHKDQSINHLYVSNTMAKTVSQ